MDKSSIIAELKNFMVEEGYAPNIDDDGDLVFKFEGRTYCLIVNEDDTMFYRLVFPNFWPIESEEERANVEIASLAVCKDTKVAKVFAVRDNVWASIELFCHKPSSFTGVFRRSLGALQTAANSFRQKMNEMHTYS
jgi:hypothetical protein